MLKSHLLPCAVSAGLLRFTRQQGCSWPRGARGSMSATGHDFLRMPLTATPEHSNLSAEEYEFMFGDGDELPPPSAGSAGHDFTRLGSRRSSGGSLPFQSLQPPPGRVPTPPSRAPPTPARLAPLATSAEEANPLRRRVESCLLQRERTIAQLTSWLRTTYRVQENVGAQYGGMRGSGSLGDLRKWNMMSASTCDDHRIKVRNLPTSPEILTSSQTMAFHGRR